MAFLIVKVAGRLWPRYIGPFESVDAARAYSDKKILPDEKNLEVYVEVLTKPE